MGSFVLVLVFWAFGSYFVLLFVVGLLSKMCGSRGKTKI